jgi:hypothetical protein
MTNNISLFSTGFVRLSSIIAPLGPIPVSKSTWWVQIPTHSGQIFRSDAGQDSDLKPATIPN